MATHLFTDAGRTWREAARQNSRGREIYEALRAETAAGAAGTAYQRIIRENAQLISTLPLHIAEDVTRYVAAESLKGRRPEDIAAEIQQMFPARSRARAELIARTETSKASSALTEARCEELDIQWYVWRTSKDQRVRDSHSLMDGVLVAWNDPPSPETLNKERGYGKYHAGNTFNCRCYPEPLIELHHVTWPHDVYHSGKISKMTRAAFERLTGAGAQPAKPPAPPPDPQPAPPHAAQPANIVSAPPLTVPHQPVILDPVEQIHGFKKETPLSISEASRGTNPQYDPSAQRNNAQYPYGINCQRCVPAYELRRRGYLVEAKPRAGLADKKIEGGYECFEHPVGRGFPFEKLTKKQFKEDLNAMPEGARCGVIVKWKGQNSGHTFVAEKEGGEIKYIDPQDPTRDASKFIADAEKVGYYRMDTLEINVNKIGDAVAEVKVHD
jgi:SPP1 gp7 family putative phage head morphogenesis protein